MSLSDCYKDTNTRTSIYTHLLYNLQLMFKMFVLGLNTLSGTFVNRRCRSPHFLMILLQNTTEQCITFKCEREYILESCCLVPLSSPAPQHNVVETGCFPSLGNRPEGSYSFGLLPCFRFLQVRQFFRGPQQIKM